MQQMKEMIEVQKVGKKRTWLRNATDCVICYAVNEKGKDIRMQIDRYAITHSTKETMQFCRDNGLVITLFKLKRHLEKHSPYLKEAKDTLAKMTENVQLAKLDKIEQQYIDADEVLQDIINVGGQAVRTGEMQVNDRLLLGALREQGQRKKMGTLQQMFSELDRKRFVEGEVVEEIKNEPVLKMPDDQKE